MIATCPNCDKPFDGSEQEALDGEPLTVGDIVECDQCGEDLEVVSLEPLTFEIAGYAGDEDDGDEDYGGDDEDGDTEEPE